PGYGQSMFGIGMLWMLLTVAYEAHAAEYAGVLVGVLPEYLDFTAGGEVLGGQYRHQRRLAGAVASEQAVDRVLFDAEADIVEGGVVLYVLVRWRSSTTEFMGHPFAAVGSSAVVRGSSRERSSMSAITSFAPSPSRLASLSRGVTKFSENAVRCSVMSSARAPSVTNMP